MSEQPKRKAAQAPVSAHPAFPAIVALWFAALFGIGSLVLPIALFDNLSEATGLSSLVAAAEPPLGVTARIAIALAAGALGVFAGLAIARQVVAASTPRPAPRRAAAMRSGARAGESTAKRPISAHEELGEGGLDDDTAGEPRRDALPGRRRALSVTDDSARSEFLDHAPLPGHDLVAAARADAAPAPVEEQVEEPLDEPLDLAEFDASPAQAEEPMVDAPARFSPMPGARAAFGTATLSAPPVPGAGFTRAEPHYQRSPAASPTPAVPEDQPMTAPHSPAVFAADTPATHEDRTPGEPAIVDLVERFARALQQHREEAQLAASDADMVVDVTFAFPGHEARAADAEPAAAPAPFAPPANPPVPVVPAALRPIGFGAFGDEDDDDGELPALGLSLVPASPFAAPAQAMPSAAAPDEPAEDPEDNAPESEESYSSLLAMKSPFGLPREAVRIDDEPDHREGEPVEPVVVFPGQATRRASPAADGPARDAVGFPGASLRPFDAPAARIDSIAGRAPAAPPDRPASSGDTERALREALEKLQKMSGTA